MTIAHRRCRIAWSCLLLALAAPLHAQSCPCDCDGDGRVAIGEVITAVRISLGEADVGGCSAADGNANGAVAINELVQGVNAALLGCGSPTPAPGTPTATPDPQLPPTDGAALLPWLEAGNYLDWTAESVIHPSGGPHGGNVRTYFNDALVASLTDEAPAHPVGAASVKELYRNSSEIMGWAVSVKVAADSAAGAGWYWYELIGTSVFADSVGAGICVSCHRGNYRTFTSKDLILAPYPLQ